MVRKWVVFGEIGLYRLLETAEVEMWTGADLSDNAVDQLRQRLFLRGIACLVESLHGFRRQVDL